FDRAGAGCANGGCAGKLSWRKSYCSKSGWGPSLRGKRIAGGTAWLLRFRGCNVVHGSLRRPRLYVKEHLAAVQPYLCGWRPPPEPERPGNLELLEHRR